MNLYKILKYLTFVIGALGIVLFIWLMSKGDAAVTDSVDLQNSILNPFLTLTYVVMAIAVVAVLIFVVLKFFEGNVKELLISLGAFIVIFLISFVSANGEPISYANGMHISGQGAKWVETGLIMFYILGIVAVLALIFSSVKKITFRN